MENLYVYQGVKGENIVSEHMATRDWRGYMYYFKVIGVWREKWKREYITQSSFGKKQHNLTPLICQD